MRDFDFDLSRFRFLLSRIPPRRITQRGVRRFNCAKRHEVFIQLVRRNFRAPWNIDVPFDSFDSFMRNRDR